MGVQTGGKTVFGATVGILMLETRFPRVPGDIGNALTWPFPVQYRVVRGATPDLVVRKDARKLLDSFVAEGRDLVQMGCDGIVTNCGFLSIIQDDLKSTLGVPVASSALMQVPMVAQTLPAGQRVGVLTISAGTLTPSHLAAAGAPPDTPVVGTDSGREFTSGILEDRPKIDFDACRDDLLEAARRLMTEHREIGSIVLECTNMVPFAADIRRAAGVPVYSIYTLVQWFHAALSPRRFPMDLDDPRP